LRGRLAVVDAYIELCEHGKHLADVEVSYTSDYTVGNFELTDENRDVWTTPQILEYVELLLGGLPASL
jgi:hypothetical protein